MQDINAHPCPRCGRVTNPRYVEHHATHVKTWYVCPACRHAWRCASLEDGRLREVTAESPHAPSSPPPKVDQSALLLRSPCCERGSRIKQTVTEEGRIVRRHQCRECSKPFYTATNDEGLVTVLTRRPVPVARAVEL